MNQTIARWTGPSSPWPVLVLLSLLAAAPAGAQDPEKPADKQDEGQTAPPRTVVVTAARREMLLSDVTDVLQVVPRREIEEMRPSSTGEILEYVPGARLETGTGSGLPKRSIVSLNGLPANYTLVLVDGVRLLSEHIHTGQNLEMIPPESIERIEIIRGAASAQYGADAIGGVVNIITRKCGPRPETFVGASAGTYHTYEGNVSILQPATEAVRASVFLHREQSDGVPLLAPAHRVGNMGYERHSGMARVDLDAGESMKAFGWINAVDNVADSRGDDVDSSLVMTAFGGSQRLARPLTLFAQASYSKWEAELAGEENEWIEPETHLVLEVARAHTFTGGVEFRRNRFTRTAVADVPEQDAFGVFFQDEWRVTEELILAGALRIDDVEDMETALSPKISALYAPDLPLRLRGSVGRGFHAPTLQELYEEGYGHGGRARRFGNPDLEPEHSLTYSLGVEVFPADALQVTAYGHYSDIDDMIVPVYEGPWSVDPSFDVWRRTNIENARVWGGEFMARYTFSPALRLEGGYTYTNTEDEDSGRQLPYHPGSSVFARVVTELALAKSDWKLSAFIGLRAAFDRSAWDWKPPAGAPVGDPSGLVTDLEDYEKLDAGFSVGTGDFSVFLNAYNLLGQDIENLDDAYTVLDGEPTFKIGFRWTF